MRAATDRPAPCCCRTTRGRLTTYAGLGALAGAGGAALGRLPWFGWLSGALLVLAALLFLRHALRRLAPSLGAALPWAVAGTDRAPRGWIRLIRGLSARVDRTRPAGGLLLGLTLGFLPCGFLYAALAAAAATGGSAAGGPLTGAAAMLCFGLGTVPSLVAVGLAGHAAGTGVPSRREHARAGGAAGQRGLAGRAGVGAAGGAGVTEARSGLRPETRQGGFAPLDPPPEAEPLDSILVLVW